MAPTGAHPGGQSGAHPSGVESSGVETSGQIGEFELIARVFAPLSGEGTFGLADDAASLTPREGWDLVLTKDALVAGVHFFAEDPWDAVAKKALRVNLSDLAAKGASPRGYLLGLGLPGDWRLSDADALGAGFAADQAEYGISLLGGDTVRSTGGLFLSVTAIGETPRGKMVRRGGARPGDVVVVTGTIGDAALGLRLRLDPDLADRLGLASSEGDFLRDRYLLPRPRTAVASAVRDHAHGAMDISDGLLGDLAKMAAASGVVIEIDPDKVPLSPAGRAAIAADGDLFATALAGGDDYEIAAALDEADVPAYRAACAAVGISATAIGRVGQGSGLSLTSHQDLLDGGGSYCHF